jgi:DNA-binding transcriptional ArsR family regulator
MSRNPVSQAQLPDARNTRPIAYSTSLLSEGKHSGSGCRFKTYLLAIFKNSNIFGIESPMQDALRQFKAEFFQALAHPTRIAIVEQLRDGELSAGTLIERLGIEQANASQHLAVLRAKNILVNRKAGNQVFYSVRDPLIIEVLALMRRYFQTHMSEVLATLKAIDKAEKVRK